MKISFRKETNASSVESASYPAANALDGNPGTIWSSSSSGYEQLLSLNLGATYDMNYVIIKWADGRYATTFDIEGSTDSSTWINLKTITGNTSAVSNIVTGLQGNYRYIRFHGRGRANAAGYRIAEMEVYDTSYATAAQLVALDTVTRRLKKQHEISVLSPTDQNNVVSWMGSMQADGSWASINYDDVSAASSWGPRSHLSRLNAFSVAYSNPTNALYHDATLKSRIELGLRYFYYRNPYSTGWFNREINAPRLYMISLILMKGVINNDSLLRYSSYLVDRSAEPAYEAANRAWAAEITVHKGSLENRYPVANDGFAQMASTLDVQTTSGPEGIKSDSSIHAHNTGTKDQLHSMGYGGGMLEKGSRFIMISRNTEFGNLFTAQRRKTLIDATLAGNQLFSYRSACDWGAAGRYISRPNTLGSFRTGTLDTMMVNEPADAARIQVYKDHIAGAEFQERYRGNKHFFKSDIMTQHGANYYLSAKIISLRSCGTESNDAENTKGANLPMGATNIMTTGNEYSNIFPMWDWTRIPGTTAQMNQDSTTFINKYLFGTNAFGGGVSDVANGGAIAFEQDYKAVTAKKAYFFMGDALVCVGTGIQKNNTNGSVVATSIDQSFLSGPVTILNGSTQQVYTGGSITTNTLKWVHHNNIGYHLPAGGNFGLESKVQSGSWSDINNGGTTTVLSDTIFSLWAHHSTTPSNRSYFYVVMPDKTLSAFQSAVAVNRFKLDSNSSNIQAVWDSVGRNYAVVFYNPGTVTMGDGLTITSDKKAMVFIHKYSDNYKVSVADPLYSQSSALIKINRNLTGPNSSYANGITTINITFPAGDLTGQTKTGFYQINSPRNSLPITTLNAAENDLSLNGTIRVYPNPAKDILYISGLKQPATVKVFSADGTLLLQQKTVAVNVKSLPAGTYLAQIISDKGEITTRRFIKQ